MFEHIPFIGDWHRTSKLGCGAFAEVWLWQHAKSKEKIVVKEYRALDDENAYKQKAHMDRCNREVEMMTNKIRHLNIIRGLRVQPDTFLSELLKSSPSKMPVLITEYCEAGDLRRQLNDNQNSSGLPEKEVRNILNALKNGLFYLHSLSKIHRNVKPENIIIHVTGDGQRIYKLSDLGCSMPKDLCGIQGKVISKKYEVYAAPELITSEKHSYSVDYWSMAMVVYEVITGFRPFVPDLPLAQWILRVRAKQSKHITIFEGDDGEFVYSNQMYAEHRISTSLAQLLEPWFKLAFEWHPKQRGYVFEKPVNSSDDSPPDHVLKFFQSVDDILEKKILTIFALSNYSYFSMEIDENTTNDDLYAFIKQKADISASKCHVIMPVENRLVDIDLSKQFAKPIDLYTDGCFDKPMIFVLQIGGAGSTAAAVTYDSPIDVEPTPICELPVSVKNVLANPEKRLKTQTLRKFACDTLHLVRNENRKYKLCLDGWRKFALQLSNDIEACQKNVKKMQMLIYGCLGALDLYKQTLEMVHEKSDTVNAGWLEQHGKITQNIERLVEAGCDKITIRFGSVFRRIRELCECEILMKRNAQDFYDIINTTKAYDALRTQILNNNTLPKPHFELLQCAYKCLKQRESLLRNKTFIEMQRKLNCVHIEFIEIKKALEKAIIPAEKYRYELNEANKKLHESDWFLVEKSSLPEQRTVSTSNSDLMQSNNNTTNDGVDTANDMIEIRKIRELQRQINEDELKNTKILINDNIDLRIKLSDVINEIDEEFTKSKLIY